MAGEESTPQVTSSEAAPSQETQEGSSNPQQGEGESSSTSQAAPAETSASSAQEAPTTSPSKQKGPTEKSVEAPASVPKSLLQTLNRRRKPISKPPQETDEEKAEREERERIAKEAADKNAAELVDQEKQEKKRLGDREAKSRQAAAANAERAREAADKVKKKTEADKAADKTSRAAARRVKKVPDKEDGDPPDDDPTPWTVYTYKQPQKVKGEYTYEGAIITNKMNAIEPRDTVNIKATVWGRGTHVKPIDQVTFLQKRIAYAGAKHRVRDIRSVQIERAFSNAVSLFPAGHMCNTKDGTSVLMRVSTPYNTDGELQLKTLPGVRPVRYALDKALAVQHLKLETDFRDNKPAPLMHCALHFATRALGYKLKDGKVDDRPTWFTPEVLRAARVFIKEVSSGQYTNEDHTKVEKPAFVYRSSVITNFPEEPNKGRFVHLVSVGLQLAQVTWMSTKQLPF